MTSEDGTIHFNQTSHGGFDYRDDKLIAQYKNEIVLGDICLEEYNKNISDSYTVSMAQQNLQKLLNEILNEEIQIISCKTVHNGREEGYYEFTFVPLKGNLPLAVNDRDINGDSIIDVFAMAQIGKAGIARIVADNFWSAEQSVTEYREEKCISYTKMLEILEQYILDGKISCTKEIVFTRVELVYLPKTDDWKEVEFIPVWRFYISADELMEPDVANIVQKGNYPTDICINAINGEIESMR